MPPADTLTGPRVSSQTEVRQTVVLSGLGALLVSLTAAGPQLHLAYGGLAHWAIVVVTAAVAGWVALTGETRSFDGPRAIGIVLTTAVAMRLALLLADPYLSDDIYRYVWDGRVSASGINPYRYVPADPALAGLRDAEIFPFINRADYAPTIYPPVAQVLFLAVTRLGESVLVMRIALLAAEAVTLAAVWQLLRRLELPAARFVIVAWHPLPVWEIAGSGHVDAAMVALLTVSLLSFVAGRQLLAGWLATLAALVKPTALLALPVYWRPWDLRLPLVFVATVLLCYAPFLSVGWKALGFLPGYVAEEELSHGTGFRYLMVLERLTGPVPGAAKAYAAVAGLAMIGLAVAAAWRMDRSAAGAVRWLAILLTGFLVLLTPHYPWYYLPLVPMLAIFPASWTLWLLTVGAFQVYQIVPGELLPDFGDRQVIFHLAVLATLGRDIAARAFDMPRRLQGDQRQ